jgi:dynein heavy chain
MEELQKVKLSYESQKHRPPASRASTPVFSAVAWARMLALRISQPMKRCAALQSYLQDESELKACSKLYSKIMKTLAAFENMWITAWRDNLGPIMSCLRATLLTLHPTTSAVTVNLDSELLCLIREAKSLVRMGINIPTGCEQLIQQEHRLKHYHSELQYIASKLQNSREKAPKMWMKLLQVRCKLFSFSFSNVRHLNRDNLMRLWKGFSPL